MMNKNCKKCNRELPMNTDYFYKNNGTKDGYANNCKECSNSTFTKYHELKDGEMFCKRCLEILPYNSEYFPVDKNTKTGLRNVCYECKGEKYGKRQEKSRFWTKEEDELLKLLYEDNANKDILHNFPNRTEKAIIDHARKLGLVKSEIAIEKRNKNQSEHMKVNSHWIGKPKSQEEKDFLSKQMKQRWSEDRETMLENVRYERTPEIREALAETVRAKGLWVGENNPRHINPLFGENNGRWQGGITPLLLWLRNQLDEWKQESMEFHNYTCVLTGKNFDEIHHLTSFKSIIHETLEELNMQKVKNLEDYSQEELELLRETIIKNNSKYGYGICLIKSVHKLFHDSYGYGDNNPEQFEEFSKRFKSGEFDELLREKEVS